MEVSENILFPSIKGISTQSREKVLRVVNSTLLFTYSQIEQLIVEDEQKVKKRAEYGKFTLKNLSKKLSLEFGKGFYESNLRNMQSFFLSFLIRDALHHELSWIYYRLILRQDNEQKKTYCLKESIRNNWSSRDLRQINCLAYERVLQYLLYLPKEKELKQILIKTKYVLKSIKKIKIQNTNSHC